LEEESYPAILLTTILYINTFNIHAKVAQSRQKTELLRTSISQNMFHIMHTIRGPKYTCSTHLSIMVTPSLWSPLSLADGPLCVQVIEPRAPEMVLSFNQIWHVGVFITQTVQKLYKCNCKIHDHKRKEADSKNN
jgi:hypothetical protein